MAANSLVCLRRPSMVSWDFFLLRVVGMTTRCDERERVVRYSSMRRSLMPKPIPLYEKLVSDIRRQIGLAGI